MKILKIMGLLLITLILLTGCSEDKTVLQSESEVYSYTIGNVELIFNFASIFGKQLTMNNANDRAVGVYVVDNNEPSMIIFSDSWTWGGNVEVLNDATFNHNQELKITIVIYNDFAGTIWGLIEALGPDFLEEIQDAWIEDEFEEIIILE